MPSLPMTKQKNWLSQLSNAGIKNPTQELRYIMRYAFDERTIDHIVIRRSKREPLAKIIGRKDFWKDTFITNQYTLDPRPDSETLIETCLALSYRPKTILELGVGTGCLLLSLLREYPNALGLGTDISQDALSVAQKNAAALQLDSRVTFVQSDWFSNIPEQKFDLIISNPPYIDRRESISPEALYDPDIALYADDQGLAAYKMILDKAHLFMHPNSYLIFEIGPSWKGFKGTSRYHIIKIIKDLTHRPRVVLLSFPQ